MYVKTLKNQEISEEIIFHVDIKTMSKEIICHVDINTIEDLKDILSCWYLDNENINILSC